MINPMELSGRKYVVTGASAGLGRQVCITLSQLGASVILIARNEERLIETLGLMTVSESAKHAIYELDLSKMEEIEPLIRRMIEENGKMDGFVHCAGLGTMRPLSSTTYGVMEEVMRVNVFSFVEILRILSKKKSLKGNGSIVAVSSLASKRGEKAKTAYTATKGALDSLIISLSVELGIARGIRVNTVNPGWIKTEMLESYIESFSEKLPEIKEAQFLGIAEPRDVANAIAFLLSDASRLITGQSLVIDGGSSTRTK